MKSNREPTGNIDLEKLDGILEFSEEEEIIAPEEDIIEEIIIPEEEDIFIPEEEDIIIPEENNNQNLDEDLIFPDDESPDVDFEDDFEDDFEEFTPRDVSLQLKLHPLFRNHNLHLLYKLELPTKVIKSSNQ